MTLGRKTPRPSEYRHFLRPFTKTTKSIDRNIRCQSWTRTLQTIYFRVGKPLNSSLPTPLIGKCHDPTHPSSKSRRRLTPFLTLSSALLDGRRRGGGVGSNMYRCDPTNRRTQGEGADGEYERVQDHDGCPDLGSYIRHGVKWYRETLYRGVSYRPRKRILLSTSTLGLVVVPKVTENFTHKKSAHRAWVYKGLVVVLGPYVILFSKEKLKQNYSGYFCGITLRSRRSTSVLSDKSSSDHRNKGTQKQWSEGPYWTNSGHPRTLLTHP